MTSAIEAKFQVDENSQNARSGTVFLGNGERGLFLKQEHCQILARALTGISIFGDFEGTKTDNLSMLRHQLERVSIDVEVA